MNTFINFRINKKSKKSNNLKEIRVQEQKIRNRILNSSMMFNKILLKS